MKSSYKTTSSCSLRHIYKHQIRSRRCFKSGYFLLRAAWTQNPLLAPFKPIKSQQLTCGSGQHPYPPWPFLQQVFLSSHMPPSGQTSAVLRPSRTRHKTPICRVWTHGAGNRAVTCSGTLWSYRLSSAVKSEVCGAALQAFQLINWISSPNKLRRLLWSHDPFNECHTFSTSCPK